MSHWAVVLAGGIGSRFWPLSTPERPKQLLPLVSDRPMVVDSVERLAPLVPLERTLVLTGRPLVAAIRSALPSLPPENIIAEPKAAGTAPALAWAAASIRRRASDAAVMISVHADWAVSDAERFRDTLKRAADVAARHSSLVTVGIVPTRPDPGFGYIAPGAPVNGARRVRRFVEKPDQALAAHMVREGYLWNSGIFVWRVGDFLDEVRAHCAELAPALGHADRDDVEAFFGTVTPVSVDVGVMERSDRVLVLPGEFGWDDVGTWAALKRVRERDSHGNAVAGQAALVDASENVVHSEGTTVVLYGVSNLVVVARGGLTMVTTVDRALQMKALLDVLPPQVRDAP